MLKDYIEAHKQRKKLVQDAKYTRIQRLQEVG